jgi:hypothetical protein
LINVSSDRHLRSVGHTIYASRTTVRKATQYSATAHKRTMIKLALQSSLMNMQSTEHIQGFHYNTLRAMHSVCAKHNKAGQVRPGELTLTPLSNKFRNVAACCCRLQPNLQGLPALRRTYFQGSGRQYHCLVTASNPSTVSSGSISTMSGGSKHRRRVGLQATHDLTNSELVHI